MNIEVSSNVKKVQFCYRSRFGDWTIKVNENVIITSAGYSRPPAVNFSDLTKAVIYAKERGLIPESFDVEQLKQSVTVTIK